MKAKYDFSKLSKKKEVKRGCWLIGFLAYATFGIVVALLIHIFLVFSVQELARFTDMSETMLYIWYSGLVIIDVIALICMVGLVRWKLWGFIGVEGYFIVLAVLQLSEGNLVGMFQSFVLFSILGYLLSMKMQKFK